MSKRETKLFLEDILDCVRKIESYTNKLSFDDFTTFAMVVDAVVRNLEIIGEASKNIPKEIQNQSTEIPWQNIIGLRNRIIHE
ncbi:MAG: DUF86 domain-containing protein, partial [Ignavibacteriales bacterium]|nr:DUF86 domain-containing protein [Ignavibacteriales bacterium]